MSLPDLDRMEIEDVSWTAEALANAIHRQLGEIPAPIPVHAIAKQLDIFEIREERLRNFEGMLQTDAERSEGCILVNASASYARRRYSVAHELGHFLCRWHRPMQAELFSCTGSDMAQPKGSELHRQQEAEANRFAIELLAPPRFVARYVRRLPDLDHVLELSSKLQLSKAAAARRFVDLHSSRLAVVFAQHGNFIYAHRSDEFPWLPLTRGEPLPPLPAAEEVGELSQVEEADPTDWFGRTSVTELGVQVLRQEDGRATVLLEVS